VDQATHNKIVSFIWGIADEVLRDLFKRGKYPDVILPMCVIRRMDAVLEPTKQKVLETRKMLDEENLGDTHNFEPRECRAISIADARPPDGATKATQLQFSFANDDRLDPFAV
jgi:type I restriction-modification system DNA methylase subunit